MLHERCNHIFCNDSNCPQLIVPWQLHLALFCLLFSGNGAAFEAVAKKYKLSDGMILNARERVYTAFSELKNDWITYPGSDERRSMCELVGKTPGYTSCIFQPMAPPIRYCTHPHFKTSHSLSERSAIPSMRSSQTMLNITSLPCCRLRRFVAWLKSNFPSLFFNGMDDPRFFEQGTWLGQRGFQSHSPTSADV